MRKHSEQTQQCSVCSKVLLTNIWIRRSCLRSVCSNFFRIASEVYCSRLWFSATCFPLLFRPSLIRHLVYAMAAPSGSWAFSGVPTSPTAPFGAHPGEFNSHALMHFFSSGLACLLVAQLFLFYTIHRSLHIQIEEPAITQHSAPSGALGVR